jgi:glycosyltransferase involved in cell wall biosynthesis
MENEKIKILFFNKDVAGVNYYRTLTPAMQLERDHSDKFQVEINSEVHFGNYDEALAYLKTFQIIHYHRFILPSVTEMIKLKRDLRANGTVLVMDIDDYWLLDKNHPFFPTAQKNKLHLDIIDNIKLADYITTTTDIFAAEIRKISGKDNVTVLYNSVNPEWMKQFQDKRKKDDKFVRVTYMAGSSHKNDVEQLRGVANILDATDVKDKYKIILAGWDTEGVTTDIKFNEDFAKALERRRLWTNEMIKKINRSQGNVDLIEGLPADIREQFRGKVFAENRRAINSVESVYLDYENVFTNNHKIIKNEDYIKWLEKFERDKYYDEDNVNYVRRWTQKANVYAEVLNETDIALAPLADNLFNRMKSNLKQVEVWSRKLPIICTDIPPYNVDGVHMKNCILIPYKKNGLVNKRLDMDWAKAIKKLIEEPNLREDLGNQLYEDFKVKYNLKHVTETRAQFYQSIVNVSVPA